MSLYASESLIMQGVAQTLGLNYIFLISGAFLIASYASNKASRRQYTAKSIYGRRTIEHEHPIIAFQELAAPLLCNWCTFSEPYLGNTTESACMR